jgi:methyltransferase family protein
VQQERLTIYFVDLCPCCNSKSLRRWPAIVSPFIAHYACEAEPGNCNLCECMDCSFRFFDSRLTDAEVQRLYAGYRGDAYFKARHSYEFWYSRRTNDGIGGDEAEIASRKLNLSRFLGQRSKSISTVLDFGGDRGQFIPEDVGREHFVYEVSDAKPVEGVTRLTSVEGMRFDFIMLAHVLEHCSEPREMLQLLKPLGHKDTLYYFEVPFERPSLRWTGEGRMQKWYLNTLLRARPLLQLVDLYSTAARIKLNAVPPFGIQKCSEHLNFFNKSSLQALLQGEGFELLDSAIASVVSFGPVGRILFALARIAHGSS